MNQFYTIPLGSGSAIPIYNRGLTSHYVAVRNTRILIDCGEGSQIRLNTFKINHHKLSVILITHLHGDHVFGLPGLLSSMSLFGRKKELTLIAPEKCLELCLQWIEAGGGKLTFPIKLIPTDDVWEEQPIYQDNSCQITAFPLKHRIKTTGYSIKEANHDRKLITVSLPAGLPFEYYPKLKKGEDVFWDGQTIRAEDHTLPPPRPKSYSFMSDTMKLEKVPDCVYQSDLLYHEATFLSTEHERAAATMHSTSKDAAQFAQLANCKKLLIGHFSGRYKDLTPLEQEAQSHFKESQLVVEGQKYNV